MRLAKVYYKKEEAGLITQHDDGSFVFRYTDVWFENKAKPSISLTLQKSKQEYKSEYLFPFFYNMLPEGTNKQFVCRHLQIDKSDYFGILLHTAQYDTIGAVTLKKIISTDEK